MAKRPLCKRLCVALKWEMSDDITPPGFDHCWLRVYAQSAHHKHPMDQSHSVHLIYPNSSQGIRLRFQISPVKQLSHHRATQHGKARKRTWEPPWPPSTRWKQPNFLLLLPLNPLNLLKHKACRTTHGKGSQEEQVQCGSPSRCCVSENLWGYGYFQTVHRPQEVSSHATIQDTSPESFQAAPPKLPRLSVHFLDGHRGTASGRPPALPVRRCWGHKGLARLQWPPGAQLGWPASVCKPAVPSFVTAGRKLTRFR